MYIGARVKADAVDACGERMEFSLPTIRTTTSKTFFSR